jgi:GR25 family glycosyltransferase involved in LPS biosynthesis
MNNCVSIWLPSLTERLPIIKTLETNLQTNIVIFHAFDGKDYVELYKDFKHILYGQKINAGMIGCVLSHLEVLKNTKSDTITIFEDDCVFHGNLEELHSFIQNAPPFDILCLGVSELVESTKTDDPNYLRAYRFWGTHALIIKEEAAKKIIETFKKYKSEKRFLPADWLYSYAIKEHNLKAYVPSNIYKYVTFKRGLYSTVSNRIRD